MVPSELRNANVTIEVADIPPTEQIRNLPTPPARPAVPVPTESELVPEDITIQSIFKVKETELISTMSDIMIGGRIHRLLVTRDEKVVGIITTLDMLKAIRDHAN